MIFYKLGYRTIRTAAAVMLICCATLQTARAEQVWSIATAYPADTVAGRGIESFAATLSKQTGGAVTGETQFKTKRGPTELVSAVLDNHVQVADVFTGALAHLDPIFELSTLPFEVTSVEASRRLTCTAEPAYRSALLRAGLHMLFISPWPPTGLWSRQPVTTVADLVNQRIRTYDDASAKVLVKLGAQAAELPVQDIKSLLHSGQIDAVLSSGDGAVGQSLEAYLPNFSAIQYAFPLSFVVMSQSRYEALPAKLQTQLDEAATETQRQQWTSLPIRIRENDAAMRHAGVVLNMPLDNVLKTRFREAGRSRMQDWLSRVSPEYVDIIKAFKNDDVPVAQSACSFGLLLAKHSPHG